MCVVLSRQAEGREKKEGKKKAHCSKVSSYVEAVPIHMRASQCFLMHSSIFLFFSLVLICLFVYFTRGAVAVVVHLSEFIAASSPSLCLFFISRHFRSKTKKTVKSVFFPAFHFFLLRSSLELWGIETPTSLLCGHFMDRCSLFSSN